MLLPKKDFEILKRIFNKTSGLQEVILFGSRALGNAKTASDIDLCLKGDDIENIILQLYGVLDTDTMLPYTFDLINYHTLQDLNLKDHIEKFGKTIWRKDGGAVNLNFRRF